MSTTAPLVPSPDFPPPGAAAKEWEVLRGWKQIAAYRDVRTVQRWERTEHLPVHRQLHLKLGTVHAVGAELDQWRAQGSSPRAGGQRPLHTRDPRAYELYLRGRQLFDQFRHKSFERAREMFSRAIALDQQFALAHAGLADCCSYLYLYWDPTLDNLRMADSASRQAVALSPESLPRRSSRVDLDGKDSAVLYNVGPEVPEKRVARSGWRKEWIKHDPDLTALRGLREFAALVS
jgi:hypothetical protein